MEARELVVGGVGGGAPDLHRTTDAGCEESCGWVALDVGDCTRKSDTVACPCPPWEGGAQERGEGFGL